MCHIVANVKNVIKRSHNGITVDCFSVAMWLGKFSSLGERMRTHGLVCPLFVAQTTWFRIPNFYNAEGESVRHGVKTLTYVTTIAYR